MSERATWDDWLDICIRLGYDAIRVHAGIEIDGEKFLRPKGRRALYLKLMEEV